MLTQDKCSDTFWARGWVWGKTNTTHATSQKAARSPIYPVLHRVFIFHICISKSTWLHIIDDVHLPCSEMTLKLNVLWTVHLANFFATFNIFLLINEKGMCLIIRRHGMTNFLAFNWKKWHIRGVTWRRRPPKYAICSGVRLCGPFPYNQWLSRAVCLFSPNATLVALYWVVPF